METRLGGLTAALAWTLALGTTTASACGEAPGGAIYRCPFGPGQAANGSLPVRPQGGMGSGPTSLQREAVAGRNRFLEDISGRYGVQIRELPGSPASAGSLWYEALSGDKRVGVLSADTLDGREKVMNALENGLRSSLGFTPVDISESARAEMDRQGVVLRGDVIELTGGKQINLQSDPDNPTLGLRIRADAQAGKLNLLVRSRKNTQNATIEGGVVTDLRERPHQPE